MKLDEARRKICKLENAYATLSQCLERIRTEATNANDKGHHLKNTWLTMVATKALTQAEIEKDNLL